MKRFFCMLQLCCILLACVSFCAAEEAVPEFTLYEYDEPFLWLENSETILALQQECDQKGTVVTLEYTAPAYAINEVLGRHEKLSKSVRVYLPFGYDESQAYDVLYLLHGTGGDDQYWLTKDKTGKPTVNLLDNMIAQGLCRPMIVVAPDWNADLKGKKNKISDDQALAYGEQNGESYVSSRNDLWCVFFNQELYNDIIPLVESQFATYAKGDTCAEKLIATRDHRAIAGLSRGSNVVFRSMILQNDIFSWFGCFSGAWVNADVFCQSVEAAYAADHPIHYWYNGNGTEDFSLGNHANIMNTARVNLAEQFTEGENMCFVVKKGSAHTYENWITDLYNVLIVFFAE